MLIVKAGRRDLPAILALQRIAFQSEAALLNDYEIPPLTQTLEGISEEFEKGLILKGMLDGKIVGSVRGSSDGGTCYVGKLMVSPEHQRKGYGAQLLSEIEKVWPHSRYELFTSDKSADNLKLYEKMGYKPFREKPANSKQRSIFLEKVVHRAE